MSLYLLVTLGKCFIGSFSRNLTPYSIWWQQSLYKWRCKKFSKPPGQRSRGHKPLIMKSQTLALNGLNKSIKVGPLLFTVIKTWKWAKCYYKVSRFVLQSEAVFLITNGEDFITNCIKYYKVRQKHVHVFIAYVDDIAVKSTISVMSSKMRSINQ